MPQTDSSDLVKVDEIEGFLPRLRDLLDEGEAHENELRAQANLQRAENVRIRKVLKSAEEVKEPGQPGRPKSRPARKQVSDARIAEMEKYFRKHGDREITSAELAEHLGWNTGVVSVAVKALREQEKVRLVGSRPGKSGMGVTKAYVLMD